MTNGSVFKASGPSSSCRRLIIPRGGPLVVLAARLVGGLHPEQVDVLAHQQLLGVPHGLAGQEARAAQDPGVVDVEDAEDVGAGVDDGHGGVVGAQDPVGAVGGDWEQGRRGKREVRRCSV